MKKLLISILLVIFCVSNCGCGFRPRSQQDFPTELHCVSLSLERQYSPLAIRLKTMLRELNVQFTTPNQASFSIIVSNDTFTASQPEPVDASLPATLTYTQKVDIQIQNNRTHTIIASRHFTKSRSLTLNANQIYTSNFENLMQQQLNRDMELLIYYWLISTDTQDALHHATYPAATRHAS